jgi:hypothetical protein
MTSSVPDESGVERREWSGESWREWKELAQEEREERFWISTRFPNSVAFCSFFFVSLKHH